MPAYGFKVIQAGNPLYERLLNLPDDHTAWEEATKACAELLKGIDGSLRQGGDLRVQVLNADHAPLFTIRVSSIVHTGEPFP